MEKRRERAYSTVLSNFTESFSLLLIDHFQLPISRLECIQRSLILQSPR